MEVVGTVEFVTVSASLKVGVVWTASFEVSTGAEVALVKLTLLLGVWFSVVLLAATVVEFVPVSTSLVVSAKAWGVKKKTSQE